MITGEVFAFANVGWVLLTNFLPVLREQREGNKCINQNSRLGRFNQRLGDANLNGVRADT